MASPSVTKQVALFVNGKRYALEIESRTTLAEALREGLDLTGTKVGCNRAECGTCTVLVDGRPIYSCTMLAVHAAGKNIQTIEGLAQSGKLHPLQQALMDEDGLQCGFCTPGMIMSLKGLLDRKTDVSRRDVREAIAGNYCRCGAYPNIVEAVLKLGRNSGGAGNG